MYPMLYVLDKFPNHPLNSHQTQQAFSEILELFYHFCIEFNIKDFFEKPHPYSEGEIKKLLISSMLYSMQLTKSNEDNYYYREVLIPLKVETLREEYSETVTISFHCKAPSKFYFRKLYFLLHEGFIANVLVLTVKDNSEIWLQELDYNGVLNKEIDLTNVPEEKWHIKEIEVFKSKENIYWNEEIYEADVVAAYEKLGNSGIIKPADNLHAPNTTKSYEKLNISSIPENSTEKLAKQKVNTEENVHTYIIWIWVAAGGLLLSAFMKGCTNTLAGKEFSYGTDNEGEVFGGIIFGVAIVLFLIYLLSRKSSN